tara:strand:- start:50 stop:961 length:912 start_codon:yes stop_codon:yes gene_type:complete
MKYFNYIIIFFFVLGIFDMLRNRPLKNYHIYGEHNKDTIVFIHGLNDDHRCWKKQIPFFSKYYKCIVVDRTSNANYLNFEDIYHIIKNNKTNGNLYCLCASYGCDAAWDIQQKYKCFNKMVFMNFTWNPAYSYDLNFEYGIIYKVVYTGWFITTYINKVFKIFNILPILIVQLLIMIPFHILATVLEYIIQGRLIYNDFWIGYKNQFLFTPLQRESQGSAYSQYMIKIGELWKNQEKIKPIKAYIPVLSLVGEHDNIGHMNRGDIAKLMSDQNCNFELVKGGGHWFFQTQSEYINKKIYHFLN